MPPQIDRKVRARDLACERQGGLCFWCGKPMIVGNKDYRGAWACTAEHHPRPRREKGTHAQSNIVAAHNWCNSVRENGRDVSGGPPLEKCPRTYRTKLNLNSGSNDDANKL